MQIIQQITVVDKNGCFIIDSVILVVTSGLGQLSNLNLNIYPNPVNDKAVIEFTNPGLNKYELLIIDISGKIIKRITNIHDNRFELSTNNLPEGIYLIELRGPKNYMGRIVIE
jgi:hypothetical protein